jgi:hypothetical protein
MVFMVGMDTLLMAMVAGIMVEDIEEDIDQGIIDLQTDHQPDGLQRCRHDLWVDHRADL